MENILLTLVTEIIRQQQQQGPPDARLIAIFNGLKSTTIDGILYNIEQREFKYVLDEHQVPINRSDCKKTAAYVLARNEGKRKELGSWFDFMHGLGLHEQSNIRHYKPVKLFITDWYANILFVPNSLPEYQIYSRIFLLWTTY